MQVIIPMIGSAVGAWKWSLTVLSLPAAPDRQVHHGEDPEQEQCRGAAEGGDDVRVAERDEDDQAEGDGGGEQDGPRVCDGWGGPCPAPAAAHAGGPSRR